MTLLQRYILFELLRVFAFVLSVLTVLLMFLGIFREVSEAGVGPLVILKILPYVIPSLLPFTIPATLLLTVTVVYGRISGDQEITAAKAAGINVLSLLSPAFMLGAVLSICSIIMTDQAIPWAEKNIRGIVSSAMEDIFLDTLGKKHQMSDSDRGYSLTVMRIDGKKLIDPIFRYTPNGEQGDFTVQAAEATLKFDLEARLIVFNLSNVYFDGHTTSDMLINSHQREFQVKFPLPFDNTSTKPRHLSIRDIRKELDKQVAELQTIRDERDMRAASYLLLGEFEKLSSSDMHYYDAIKGSRNRDVAKLHTEIHSRMSLSASCLFFALLGGPFAILKGRQQFLTSFFICFLPILLLYYPIALLMINLSKTGKISPVWSMWVANAVIFVGAAIVLRRTLKH